LVKSETLIPTLPKILCGCPGLECEAAAVKAQKELEGLAAFVIRAAQKAPGWGTNQFN